MYMYVIFFERNNNYVHEKIKTKYTNSKIDYLDYKKSSNQKSY